MIQQTVTCDGCGAQKREVNHWHKIYFHADGSISITEWSGRKRGGTEKHYCGAACVHKVVDGQIAKKEAARP